MSRAGRAVLLAVAASVGICVSAAAQAAVESTSQGGADAPGVAATYAGRLDEVNGLSDAPARSALSVHLVLRRDAATFNLDGGTLSLLGPIGGRTVAAVYQGPGTFTYAPASRLEQRRLTRSYKSSSLVAPLAAVVFVFSDSTLAELSRTTTFGAPASLPGDVKGRIREMLNFVSDPDSKSPDPDVMGDLLNGASSDLFYAHVVRSSGDPVMFMLDPYAIEGSRLLGRARRAGWTRMTQVVSQSRRVGDSAAAVSERRAQIDVTHYTLDVAIPRNNAGEVSFTAAARLDLAATVPVGPWVAFQLFPKLKLDSARWGDGTPAEVAKLKDASELWLRLEHPLAAGETRPVTIYYHGDLIDRYDDLLYIKSSISWYPLTLEGRTKATFDLTFHTPPSYRFASIGERVDSATDANGLVRTRWVTSTPVRNASFNLGVFKDYTARAEGLPPVVVLYSEQAHRRAVSQRHARSGSARMC